MRYMTKMNCWLLMAAAVPVVLPGPAGAKDRYMAVGGTDSGTCTNEASPCRTLGYSMKQMQGGDTLYIGDGTYTGSGNQIWQFQVPPSGTAAAPTVIRAKNIPGQNGIAADQPLKVKFTDGNAFNVQGPGDSTYRPPKYVKFWGIRWNGIATYTGWDHIIFKQCASQGANDGNSAAITIGGSYNLLEDVVAFGKGRYKFLFYDFGSAGASDNLCRRCIVRQDWAMKNDTSPLPIAGYSSYYNRRTAFLNSMVIDSDNPAYWNGAPTELAGAFYQPNDTGPHALTIKGSMVINTALPALYVASNSSGHVVSDFAAVKVAGGLGAQGQMSVNRATLLDVGSNQFSYRSSTQKSRLLAPDVGVTNWTGSAVTLTNTLLKGVSGDGINGGSIAGDGIVLSGVAGTLYSKKPKNYRKGNPLAEGLMYPVRIEAGSPLSTRGSDGGQIGARIVNKLGVDGTFKGEAGWDVEQAEPLWPWPLEAWVRAEMRAMDVAIGGDAMPDPRRGFCADGQTLTNYVWGYLGRTLPPFGTRFEKKGDGITLMWDPNTHDRSITGYRVYAGTLPGTYDLPGYAGKNVGRATSETIRVLQPGKTCYLAVSAVDAVRGESGLSQELLTGPPVPHAGVQRSSGLFRGSHLKGILGSLLGAYPFTFSLAVLVTGFAAAVWAFVGRRRNVRSCRN